MSLCPANTATTTSGPPREVLDAYLAMINQARGVAGQPLNQYSGERLAGLSGTQQAGINAVNEASGIATPYINSAAELYGRGAQPVSTGATGIATTAGNAANANAAGYGSAATGAATRAADTAGGIAAGSGAAATGIANEGSGTARTQAQQGIDLARTGAVAGAAGATSAAGTDVWSQLPQFQQGIASYMSPYTSDVVNSTQALFNNQNAQEDERLKGNIISSGAWGGDRAGVAQGIAAGQRALSQNSAIANLMNTGFQQGTSQYNTDKALQAGLGQNRANLMASTALGSGNLLANTGTATGGLGANTALTGASLGANTALGAGSQGINAAISGGQLTSGANLGAGNLTANTALSAGNMGIGAAGQDLQAQQMNRANAMGAGQGIAGLGTQAQQTALAGAGAQLQAGGLEQAQEQAQLNIPYQQFLEQQAYPFQTTQWLSSLIGSLGSGSGGTSSTTGPGQSPVSTAAGLGMGAYGLWSLLSDKRAKEGIEHVGYLKDGQKIHRYNYKGDPTPRIGLIAQEVEKNHPEAVTEHDGIKAVDYRKATEDSVRRAVGGVVPDGIGGLTYVPDTQMRSIGSGPPRPPSLGGGKSGIGSDILSSLDHFDRIRKLLGRKKARDDDSDMEVGGGAAGIASPDWFEEERSVGGVVDDRFDEPTTTGGGIAVPRLAIRSRTPIVIPEKLTRNFASRAADADGKSLLPSTTYRPPVGPWTTTPPPGEGGGGSGGGSDETVRGWGIDDEHRGGSDGGDHRRGGRVRRDEGGIIPDDDEPDASYDLADDGDGGLTGIGSIPDAPQVAEGGREMVPGGAAGIAPFATFDHVGPDGTTLPGPNDERYASRYKPRAAKDTTKEDTEEAKGMAALAAAAGMLGSRSPFAGVGLGAGIQSGIQTYVGLKEKSKDRNAREAQRADEGSYRADNLRLTGVKAADAAKNFSEQLELKKQQITQSGKHMENADALAVKRLDLTRAQLQEVRRHHGELESAGKKGEWQYLGTDPNAEDPAKAGVYFNNRTKEQYNGPVVKKDAPAKADSWDYIGTDPNAEDPKKNGVYHNKATNEVKYGVPVTKPTTSSVLGAAGLSPEGLRSVAEQYVAGDKGVLSGFGRSPPLLAALREEILKVQREKGMGGAEQAATMAEFAGQMAGSRSLGTMAAKMDSMAVEAKLFAENALKASDSYPRGKWVPVNRAINFFNTNTGDPAIRSFGAYNNSLINAYSNVIGRGSATVSDRDHARELLSTADSPAAYKAVVKAMLTEIDAALKSPEVAQDRIRSRITGQPGAHGAAAPAASAAPGGDMPTFRTPEEAKASGLPSGSVFYTGRTLPSGAPEIKSMP